MRFRIICIVTIVPLVVNCATLTGQINQPLFPSTLAEYGPSVVCGLDPESRLIVSVVDVSGAFFPEVEVILTLGGSELSATTDEGGLVYLRGLETGRYRLAIRAPGFEDAIAVVRLQSGCLTAVIVPLMVASSVVVPENTLSVSRRIETALDDSCVLEAVSEASSIDSVSESDGYLQAVLTRPDDPDITVPSILPRLYATQRLTEAGDIELRFVVTQIGRGGNLAWHSYIAGVIGDLLSSVLTTCVENVGAGAE